jgi:hypothetical protein
MFSEGMDKVIQIYLIFWAGSVISEAKRLCEIRGKEHV